MLTGNGRHRRPRQAPAIVVAAGVTGSAIALPLLATGSASAADGSTWDHVAQCESGGSWSANSGNGYFGGLQLTQDDWESYGGLKYAQSADEASRSQQIAVAQRILDDKGASAFGTCALLTGLGHDRRDADVNTGVDDGDDSSHGSSSHSKGSQSGSGSSDGLGGTNGGGLLGDDQGDDTGSAGESAESPLSSESPDGSDSSVTPGSSGRMADGSAAPGSGSVSQAPSASVGADSGVAGLPGRSGSPAAGGQYGGNGSGYVNDGPEAGVSGLVDTGAVAGSGRHRGTGADEASHAGAADASGKHAARAEGGYTVRVGDSLAGIADALDVRGGWEKLYDLNKDAVGSDPSRIVPGQTLRTGA